MASVKTAISVDAALFKEAERISRKLRISRSRFFAQAVRDFIHRYRGRELLERINEAYGNFPDAEEAKRLEHEWRYQRRRMREPW